MRKIARKIRVYNPIPSKYYSMSTTNQPVKYMIEDLLEKDLKESYFIQISDFISYFVHMYFVRNFRKAELPTRVTKVVNDD